MFICQFCNRVFSNRGGLVSHELHCALNPKRVQRKNSPLAHKKRGTLAWNSGLVGDPRCKHAPDFKSGASGRASTQEKELERIAKITSKAKLNNGGYRKGSGRGKKGWYSGIFCDSSWELAYILYAKDNDFSITKNTEFRTYEWKGKIRKYLPDFIVNGRLVEIKGYKTEQWIAKYNSNQDVDVLYEDKMKPILEYVTEKYGKNFIKLYEESRDAGR